MGVGRPKKCQKKEDDPTKKIEKIQRLRNKIMNAHQGPQKKTKRNQQG